MEDESLLEDPVASWFRQLAQRSSEPDSDDEGPGEHGGGEEDGEQPAPRVLMVVGKCGVGKSAFANQICGRKIFESRRGAASVTQDVQIETRDCCLAAGGSPVCVVDTIGFGDPDHGPEVTQTALREQLDALEAVAQQVEGVRWCILLAWA